MLSFGIVDGITPNAFASGLGDRTCLGLNTGLLLSLVEATSTLRDDFGAFGNAQKVPVGGRDPSRFGLQGFIGATEGRPFSSSLLGSTDAPDSVASSRGSYLISCGLHFAAMHELAHIANGHLAWLSANGSDPHLYEVDEADVGGRPLGEAIDMMRFFEHEADVWALQTLVRATVHGEDVGAIEGVVEAERLPLLILSFLILVATWIGLDVIRPRSSQATHPANLDRLMALPMAMMGVLEEAPGRAPAIGDGLKRARIVVNRLAQHLPGFAAMDEVFQAAGVQRADQIVKWMRLMDARRDGSA